MRNNDRKLSARIIFLCVIFLVIGIVYVARMIYVTLNIDPVETVNEYRYEREEPIQALRGQIYDREGRVLVYNSTRYDMVFDYDAMAADNINRNYAILQAVYSLNGTGNSDKRAETEFPFYGTYPNYTYTDAIKDTESAEYYHLLRRIAENELEEDAPIAKNKLTASYLEDFYRQEPDKFPAEQEIVDWFLERYKINAKDSNGEPLFSDREIDIIIRVRYDMEINDFSIFNRYVFAEDVDMSFMTYVKELSIVGSDFSVVTDRKYAYPGYCSHILGRVGKIPSEKWEYYKSLGYGMNSSVGLDGCEAIFEEYLRGQDGIRVVVEDDHGNIIDSYVKKEPVSGKDIYLTIDIDLQIAAEDGLEINVKYCANADSGAVTAIDPKSGEVLVLASYPTFNIETYASEYNELIADPTRPLYNRALDGLYAPGSTFKVGMVAAGITSGTVNADTCINCSGRYMYYSPSYTPKCWVYPGSHGDIDAADALKVSCNCYFYELGRLMGIDLMNYYCTGYGLGQSTGIELGDKKGILASPTYREENGLDVWTPGNTIQAAIGQSDNNFTPLQLSVYIATVLNGGKRYGAHLLKEVREYGSGKVIYQGKTETVSTLKLSSEAVGAAKEGMRRMAESSSMVQNFMGDLPVTIGGKTGTAELGGTKEENGLFVCAAPYNDPEIVVSSVIEHAGGGSYAVIAASYVLNEYYDVEE